MYASEKAIVLINDSSVFYKHDRASSRRLLLPIGEFTASSIARLPIHLSDGEKTELNYQACALETVRELSIVESIALRGLQERV